MTKIQRSVSHRAEGWAHLVDKRSRILTEGQHAKRRRVTNVLVDDRSHAAGAQVFTDRDADLLRALMRSHDE
jgi:hypothetical protein